MVENVIFKTHFWLWYANITSVDDVWLDRSNESDFD